MKFKTLDDVDVEEQMVLLRVDINAPVVNGRVLDSPRFPASVETIKELLEKKAMVAILAHQGRKGDKDFLPLDQHAEILSRYMGKKIQYVDDLFGDAALEAMDNLRKGEAVLLKNVREFEDETKLEESRFHGWCKLFDFYVNDAFSVCHRKQGSIVIPPQYLPSVAGRSLEKELKALDRFDLGKWKGKGVFILGGAKVDDYLPLFKVLEHKKNVLVASGVLGNLFLVERGYDLGYEKQWLEKEGYGNLLPELKKFKKYGKQMLLPEDFVLKNRKEVSLEEAPYQEKIMDLGKKSIECILKELDNADIIFMKGPLGFAEIPEFSYGTVEVLKRISQLTKEKKVFSLLGGGHLTTAIEEHHIPDNFSYTSLSGGALIAYLSGEKMPGLEALEKSIKRIKI